MTDAVPMTEPAARKSADATGRPRAAGAVLALVLLGSSACSSDDASAGPATGSDPAATTSVPAAGGTGNTPDPRPSTAPGGSGSDGGTGTGGADPGRCSTSALTAGLTSGAAGAGQRSATLTLTNVSGSACRVEGYGGVGLLDGSGRPLPTDQVRVPTPAPGLVTVAPGAAVVSQLQWSVVPGDGDAASGECQPSPATLTVIPPDETDAVTVAWSLGPVCEGGTIRQQAYTTK
ncbi:DUF4232 domain-containing protein [Blastococcus xanthinilyticus]|uniref:Uncharacterized protein DUF4232 n=1 Tax=Blastococcus xanthinilyticus TaxID=1564164 RepID=A0A5S5D153_9ACTN|nr:DUF4232 domain-containing protein [Blastococcus xanthinilyticus]TYP88988.1 uncharacterized protein DUF4232 [Blastococcus xanthinilyticus]